MATKIKTMYDIVMVCLSHNTISKYIYKRRFNNERLRFHTPKDIFEAQEQRLEYREFYNNKRPHFALNLDTPASHYKHSEIKYPGKIERWDYPYGT